MTDPLAALAGAGFRGELAAECRLAPFTSWRIGGPAELLATPLDRDDLTLAMAWARRSGTPWRILGNGSNLLVDDDGVRGLVLRVRKVLAGVQADGTAIQAGAGALFPAVARHAAGAGLTGIEFGAGIPGTVGGAVVMNAGWHEYEIGNVIDAVEFARADGEIVRLAGKACGFGYRSSIFRDRRGVVLGVRLQLRRGDPAEIQERLSAFAASRKANQPTEVPSCGSVFLKPPGDFAGRLIERAGLKGRRVGNIQVSPRHANFFVNLGGGTSAQALELVELVEDEVRRKFGVRLVREFERW